jgi:hypothetical protein
MIAFLYPGLIDILPCLIFFFLFCIIMFTLTTVTLNNFSIFFFIDLLFAPECTLKTVLFNSERIVAFSVIIGCLIESTKLI